MDLSRPIDTTNLLTLQEAAQTLAVSVDVLLRWNDSQILKPTITQTGQIGYTKDQINQFLSIQQSLRTGKTDTNMIPLPAATTSLSQPINSHTPTHQKKGKTEYFRIVSSAAVILSVVAITILAQQGQFDDLFRKSHVLGPQTTSTQLVLPPSSAQPVSLAKNSQDTDTSAFSAKETTPLLKTKQKTTSSSTRSYSVPIASVAAAMKAQGANVTQQADNTYTFADTQTAPTNTNNASLFDKSGNITGPDTQATVLAMNIAGAGFTPSNDTIPTSTNTNTQLILFCVATSGLSLFLFRRSKKTIPEAQLINSILPSQKIFEIDQKMDGTIVLSIHGKDYKISKPELHSDSDRFFERLMEVVGHGVKEIEYDNYNDDKMRLSTPLSRLVTRLGFVGIKRDLFFPRTSKHNVLFRKYITHEDLEAMHISTDQVVKDLLQTF